jgi:hypothetical protein
MTVTEKQEVVHPIARRTIDAGDRVVEGRRNEDDQARPTGESTFDSSATDGR